MHLRGITHVQSIAAAFTRATVTPRSAAPSAGSLTLASDVWTPSGEVPPVTPIPLVGASDEDPGAQARSPST